MCVSFFKINPQYITFFYFQDTMRLMTPSRLRYLKIFQPMKAISKAKVMWNKEDLL